MEKGTKGKWKQRQGGDRNIEGLRETMEIEVKKNKINKNKRNRGKERVRERDEDPR